jgi:putative phosphoribosyl transferase
VAKRLDFKHDILLSEKIKAPNNKNVTIAIITESEDVVIHHQLINSFEIEEDFIYTEANYKYNETILNYKYKYREGNKIIDISNKKVILIDESIETGFSMYAAIKSMITLGAKNIYIVSPIIDKIAYNNLLTLCDGIYSNYKVLDYVSTDYYYKILDTL